MLTPIQPLNNLGITPPPLAPAVARHLVPQQQPPAGGAQARGDAAPGEVPQRRKIDLRGEEGVPAKQLDGWREGDLQEGERE